jgi:hypothetical protein
LECRNDHSAQLLSILQDYHNALVSASLICTVISMIAALAGRARGIAAQQGHVTPRPCGLDPAAV